jgi:peptide/nickel transport system substrate-binding protein
MESDDHDENGNVVEHDVPENVISRRHLLSGIAVGGATLAAPRFVSRSVLRHAAAVRRSAVSPLHVVWTNVALPPNIDPGIGFDSDSLQVIRNVYEGLLEYAPGSTTVRPALARSYSVSADGLTYTFQLRKGVVFHDGTQFNAAAAVKSLDRIKEINQGPASLISMVKSFEAVGDSTVVLKLSAPYAFLPGVMPWLPIVSPAALSSHATKSDPWAEKWFASNAAGTGPYMLSSFSPTSSINLVQNTHYWQPWKSGTPTSGSLTLNANVTTQLELLQSGQVDFLGAISPDNAVTAKSLSNVVLLVQPGLEVQILPLNMSRAPMDNPKVRQAMVKAFDYSAFKTFNKGFGGSANSPVPPGLPGWDASIPAPAQDLHGAAQLLHAAGVKPGTTLSFVGVEGLDYETFAGTVLQSALGKLGLKLNAQLPPWPVPQTMFEKGSAAPHIGFLNLSANTNDPSTTIRTSWASSQIASKGGYNWSYYQNPSLDADLAAFGGSTGAKQRALITRMQRTIVKDATAIFAFAPQLTEPVAKKWRNSRYDALYDENVIRWFYTQSAS